MFALLEHQTDCPAEGRPSTSLHWDFVIELPGQQRLATWRLAENPIGRSGAIVAERIADHRRMYLNYEGQVSGGRGRVRRIDRGDARVIAATRRALLAELSGQHLRGVYEIVRARGSRLLFRAAPEADSSDLCGRSPRGD